VWLTYWGRILDRDELLRQYAAGERDFRRFNLAGAVLAGANLQGAVLQDANLQDADLKGAVLRGADLFGADLRSASLDDAQVEGADFFSADLRAAGLLGTNLSETSIDHALINLATYHRSRWAPDDLARLESHGMRIENLHEFPPDAQAALAPRQEGLTLHFNTKITAFDRYLVDGVIFGTLGPDTDCQVVRFEQHEDAAIVRLQAKEPADLERVANALWDRVWEDIEARRDNDAQAIAHFATTQAREQVSAMRDKLERMELLLDESRQAQADIMNALPNADAVERLNDEGAEHVGRYERAATASILAREGTGRHRPTRSWLRTAQQDAARSAREAMRQAAATLGNRVLEEVVTRSPASLDSLVLAISSPVAASATDQDATADAVRSAVEALVQAKRLRPVYRLRSPIGDESIIQEYDRIADIPGTATDSSQHPPLEFVVDFATHIEVLFALA